MQPLQDTGGVVGFVYLIHLSEPIKGTRVRHYLGWTGDVDARLKRHRQKRGSRLLSAAVKAGITFELVRTWKGTRSLERQIKNQRNHPRICPICRGVVPVFEHKGDKV